jgi:hypothetical protein
MRILRQTSSDGSVLPPAFAAIAGVPANYLFHETHGLRHPLSAHGTSLRLITAEWTKTIDDIDTLNTRYRTGGEDNFLMDVVASYGSLLHRLGDCGVDGMRPEVSPRAAAAAGQRSPAPCDTDRRSGHLAKRKAEPKSDELVTLDRIKTLAVTAMFSDEQLLDELVLKGGNALALIHKLTSRESVDLDFSMRHDFPGGVEAVQQRIESALVRTFQPAGYQPFDFKMAERPARISEDMAGFWGGYGVEFKLVTTEQFAAHKDNLEFLRRSALSIGQGRKFLIDISRFEYVDDKQQTQLDGYRIFVYSPLMIACEKLRAICQQMDEYAPVVKRSNRPGAERARDFLDIHTLVDKLALDLTSAKAVDMTREMFRLKRVELAWLGNFEKYREFHRQGFVAVKATVSPGVELREFDFYFDFVAALAAKVLGATLTKGA